MKEVARQLYNALSNYAALNAVVGTKIYPMLANEKVQPPFCLYGIENSNPITKEANEYNIYISVYFEPNNTLEATEMCDVLIAFAEENDFDYANPTTGIDPDSLYVSATISINLIQ